MKGVGCLRQQDWVKLECAVKRNVRTFGRASLRKDHYRIRSDLSEQFEKKPRALLPRVFGSSASDFDVRWVRSGRQVCLNSPWTASWRVLLKLKALRPFQEVNCCSPVRSSATVD